MFMYMNDRGVSVVRGRRGGVISHDIVFPPRLAGLALLTDLTLHAWYHWTISGRDDAVTLQNNCI